MRYVFDVLALIGTGLIGVGAWWIYPPAALMIVGAILLTLSIFGARRNGHT